MARQMVCTYRRHSPALKPLGQLPYKPRVLFLKSLQKNPSSQVTTASSQIIPNSQIIGPLNTMQPNVTVSAVKQTINEN